MKNRISLIITIIICSLAVIISAGAFSQITPALCSDQHDEPFLVTKGNPATQDGNTSAHSIGECRIITTFPLPTGKDQYFIVQYCAGAEVDVNAFTDEFNGVPVGTLPASVEYRTEVMAYHKAGVKFLQFSSGSEGASWLTIKVMCFGEQSPQGFRR
jgi:hypothetical protein